MHILLVGEYSRLHNSLKEGLLALGHTVVLVSDGDGFKQYPSDYSIAPGITTKGLPNIIRQAIFRLTRYDIAGLERGIRFYRLLKKLKGFDTVQLINEAPLKTIPRLEQYLLKKLIGQNHKTFLLCCSIDYVTLNFMLKGGFTYSMLDPILNDEKLKKQYRYIFDYNKPGNIKLHNFLMQNIQGIIASDMDYYLPFISHPKFLGLIPNPVNLQNLSFIPLDITGPIKIFLGINRWNYHPKGIVFFEEALKLVKEQLGNRIEIIVAENIPYKEYINLYNSAHILLDQVYAYDQGYNALEAMAKGKVVFTGAEAEFMDFYNLTEPVAINALPNAAAIANQLVNLVENPQQITVIGTRARAFIEKEHNHITVAKQYAAVWQEG
jgi:glycosyltransferase involved in cell wall biosynthesis